MTLAMVRTTVRMITVMIGCFKTTRTMTLTYLATEPEPEVEATSTLRDRGGSEP